MLALVTGPLLYFPQIFSNFCIQIYSFGLGLGFSALIPNLVHFTTHSSCVSVTLQVTDE